MTAIRALHVFPLFGADLPNGSERYAYLLTRELSKRADIQVFTTCARGARWKAGLALEWHDEFPPGSSQLEGFSVRRFRTPFSIPKLIGQAAEWLSARHVERQRRRLGLAMDAQLTPEQCHAIMARQNRWSDRLGLLSRGPLSLGLYLALWRALPDADVVLVTFFPLLSVPAVVWMARRRGKPVIVLPMFHATDLINNSRTLGDAVTRASAVLTQTGYTTRYLPRIHPGCRTVEVGAGADPGILTNAAQIDGARFRAKFRLADRKIVLFVGRKQQDKRYDLAVEAIQFVGDPSAVLVMAGEDVDGKPIESERVRYLGRLTQQDLWDAFDACDVFVLPSELESFGLVFLEAWARSKPVIGSSRCPAVASLIEDSTDGFLCADVRHIASRLNQLLGDAALRETMGAAGHRKLLANYTWEMVAERVHAVYEDCLGRVRSPQPGQEVAAR